MTHEQFAHRLGDYLDLTLSTAERREVEAHRDECAECHDLLESVFLTLRELHAFPSLDPPAGLTTRILEHTNGRRMRPGFWEQIGLYLQIPRITPLGAAALLSLPLFLLAGTNTGNRAMTEISMATQGTYSRAVRLYYRSEDIRETALAVKDKIPGQVEQTVGWLRQRFGGEAPPRPPREEKPTHGGQQSGGPPRSRSVA